MKQEYFVDQRKDEWQAFQTALGAYEKKVKRRAKMAAGSFIDLYRSIAKDLAIAKTRGYSNELVQQLNELTVRGHNVIYVSQGGWIQRLVQFFAADFPREVRQQIGFVALSAALFLGPAAVVAFLIVEDYQNVHAVLTVEQVEGIEQMYDPDLRNYGRPEQVDSRVGAFGFYVFNNASIGLRAIAMGIFLGLGTAYILVFNGVYLSAVATHLLLHGYGSTLTQFVAGHSAMELTAIVIAGTAGLLIGKALVAPGNFSRSTALRRAGRHVFVLACGTVIMFVLAAFIEAFWSPLRLPAELKYGVGAALWILVFSYFVFAGRDVVRRHSN